MKRVIVLAAAVGLFAAPAIAAISGTKHDLSSGNSGSNSFASDNVDEICVFCHTPHGASSAGFAPLWNRGEVNLTLPAEVYGGVDINATYDETSYNTTDAPLCLSCHDGASLTDNLNNPPNIGGVQTQPTFSGGDISGQGNLGTDLSNDHPIGFDYSTVNALDPEIKLLADAKLGGANFYGAGQNMMWCSSCHDVHGKPGVSTFLLVDNAGSDLCLACHIK